MRTPRRIKQRMYYVLPTGLVDVYETDSKGKIKYQEVNGKRIPILKTRKMQYSAPVMFYCSITSDLTADDLASFGADNSGKKAKMTYRFNEFPFKSGVLIWKNSSVEYKDNEIVPTSADFEIVGIRDTGQLFWNALLKEVVK